MTEDNAIKIAELAIQLMNNECSHQAERRKPLSERFAEHYDVIYQQVKPYVSLTVPNAETSKAMLEARALTKAHFDNAGTHAEPFE